MKGDIASLVDLDQLEEKNLNPYTTMCPLTYLPAGTRCGDVVFIVSWLSQGEAVNA